MNINERNEIVKLIEPNILPNTVQIEVKVTDDEKLVEEKEVVVSEDISLENLDLVSDDEDNEEIETLGIGIFDGDYDVGDKGDGNGIGGESMDGKSVIFSPLAKYQFERWPNGEFRGVWPFLQG